MKLGPDFDQEKLKYLDNTTLHSRDLDLTPFHLDYIDDDYMRWMHDDTVIKHTRLYSYDRTYKGLIAYAERVINTPGSYFWSVVHRLDNKRIGTAKLVIDLEHGIANWGYLIGEKDYWRDSAAIQAQVSLIDFAFFTAGVRKVHGSTYSDHIKSRFNLARMEFSKEGVLRSHFRRGDKGAEIVDLVSYGMLKEEWQKVSSKFDNLKYG